MNYDSYSYLWPPRPEKAVPLNLIKTFENRGYLIQTKMNGANNLVFVNPSKQLICKNRHNEDHSAWSPTDASSKHFKNLPGDGWYVFVAELLHAKVKGIRDVNYVHDILVYNGEYLVGKTLDERQEILRSLFLKGGEKETVSHYVVDDNLWIVKNVYSGFDSFFKSLDKPEHEGVVIKRRNAKLTMCSRQGANAAWQVKSRRIHKNYSF